MGSPDDEIGRMDNEGPQHWVIWTNGRWLADTPVTQALWTAVTGENPSYFQNEEMLGGDRPVEHVSWDQSSAVVEKIGLRLPSEAEWEHACRAGTTTATWAGNLNNPSVGNTILDDLGWYLGNSSFDVDHTKMAVTSRTLYERCVLSRAGTRAVRQKRPNPLGLYDMLGNVYEWTVDPAHLYKNETVVDSKPAPYELVDYDNAYRVSRGGSWSSVDGRQRAARRVVDPPQSRYDNIGLRLARDANPDKPTKGDR